VKTIARPVWLLALLAAGLVARLFFIGNAGFHIDVGDFESWALTLAEKGFPQFYSKAGFADYPPGYFYILGAIGWVWEFFRHADPRYDLLKMMIKVPAIVADLCVGVLLYKLVLRFAGERWALGAAALYVLNPAVIAVSAMWGQVDSIAGGLALLAVYLLLRSEDDEARARWFVVGAWLAFAYSLLVKPQAAILIPLFIAWVFVDASRRDARLKATATGIAAALVMTLLVVLPFHPTANPIDAFGWLLHLYASGASGYASGSVNAFNLWAIRQSFWMPDTMPTLWLPQYVWAIALLVAAATLIVWRYLQGKTQQLFVEAAALLLLAFFMLSTRMHERYIFDGLLFTIACVAFARRYLWASIAFSFTTLLNIVYSLQFLAAEDDKLQVNTADLWGFPDHLLSFVNVATFFALGYLFLGSDAPERVAVAAAPAIARSKAVVRSSAASVRRWFDPAEGLTGMRGWIDWAVAGALGVASFVLSYVGYATITTQIFDEIYFARAGKEYLSANLPIYENTHPPLTKLLITLSMILFGGDHAAGWRFLDVVFGALVIVLLYVFAKRVTGSTVFAALATSFFLFDGMHFVQSRIATPEGFVVFFATAATYAFYRFWIAAQVNVRKAAGPKENGFAFVAAYLSAAAGFAAGLIYAFVAYHARPEFDGLLWLVTGAAIGLWAALLCYLVARLVVLPRMFPDAREEISYPDGSDALRSPDGRVVLETPDGGVLDSAGKTPRLGARTQAKANGLLYTDDDLQIAYARDATVSYQTPAGDAALTPGVIAAGGGSQRGKDARVWLVAFTVALGCLVASKWYGVMGFGVSFIVVIGVWLQQFVTNRRAALWGNPRGYRLDVAIATIAFVSATVYGLIWIPDIHRQVDIKNAADVVLRQYSMYEYHRNLVATHPYASQPWMWPLDARPIAYYYKDFRKGAALQDNSACCLAEVLSLPNPFTMWFGLLAVPFVGYLAWVRRNKGYALIVLTYLLQWLPWFLSPRLIFAYHFYVNVPLICLCNAIALQWIWEKCKDSPAGKWAAIGGIAAFTLVIAGAFVFFYPILAGTHITWNEWHARIWNPLGANWI